MPDLMATNNKTSVIIAVPACLIYGPPTAEAAAAMCLSTLLLWFSYIPCYGSAEKQPENNLNPQWLNSVAQCCYSQRLLNTDHSMITQKAITAYFIYTLCFSILAEEQIKGV